MLHSYVGLPYDLWNKTGVNCWGLVSLVYADIYSDIVCEFLPKAEGYRAITAAFTAAFSENKHGFKQVEKPTKHCVVIMKHRLLTHCGIYEDGKVLHANGQAKQVIYQDIKEASRRFDTVEYWARDND